MGVAPVAAEPELQLCRVRPSVLGGVHGVALEAVAAERSGVEPGRLAACLDDARDDAGIDRSVAEHVGWGPSLVAGASAAASCRCGGTAAPQ